MLCGSAACLPAGREVSFDSAACGKPRTLCATILAVFKMKIILTAVLLLALTCFTKGQTPTNAIDGSGIKDIHNAIYRAYKKAKAHDTAYYEGFFILKLANPFKSVYNQVLTSSTDHVKIFGDKILSKLDEKSFPRIDATVHEIVIPVINLVKCKKHKHVSLEEFQHQIRTYLEDENFRTTDSVLVLSEFSMTGYHH